MTRKRIAVDMPIEIYDKLQKVATEHDRSISSMVTRLVAISIGARKPETDLLNTQLSMPTTDEEREAMMGRIR